MSRGDGTVVERAAEAGQSTLIYILVGGCVSAVSGQLKCVDGCEEAPVSSHKYRFF